MKGVMAGWPQGGPLGEEEAEGTAREERKRKKRQEATEVSLELFCYIILVSDVTRPLIKWREVRKVGCREGWVGGTNHQSRFLVLGLNRRVQRRGCRGVHRSGRVLDGPNGHGVQLAHTCKWHPRTAQELQVAPERDLLPAPTLQP